MDAMLEKWTQDPSSVHSSWDAFFRTGEFQLPGGASSTIGGASAGAGSGDANSTKLNDLIRAHEQYGHMKANLDPLGLADFGAMRGQGSTPGLELAHYGWTEKDLDTKTQIGPHDHPMLQSMAEGGFVTIKQVYDRLQKAYCGSIGYEVAHVREYERLQWLLQEIEKEVPPSSEKEIAEIMDRLTWADHFERFLATKYPAQKRFGLDGAETLIPCMKALIDEAAKDGVEDFVIGMPHRGRLNVLANVVRKNMGQIFHEFSGMADAQGDQGSGDVKYHLGTSHDRVTVDGNHVHLSMMPNPSHLEAVNPLVLGKARAKMFYKGDESGHTTAPLLIHGDAAFAGQGIVFETLSFTDLPAFQTGGCLHIVVNNQIGFTTDTFKARSTPYCTDVAKSIGAPIFHVNADDAEAVVSVARFAARYRQKFKQDIIIDLICYRRFGHNEGDEPSFTQPVMYKKIRKHPSTLEVFKQTQIAKGTLSEERVSQFSERVNGLLVDAFEAGKVFEEEEGSGWMDGAWEGFKARHMPSTILPTSISEDQFTNVGNAVTNLPEGFNIHPRIKKIWGEKELMFKGDREIDWGTAEQIAIGSLLLDGVHVRLSGQDVERGTFSHRHSVLHEQKTCTTTSAPQYRPLCHIDGAKAEYTISNSNLSEYGVLGFEMGYSMENPNALVLWEAQFGDFANGAQIIFDQFLSSTESKWRRQCGLVVLLPHGFEGGGPEHSSCRLERFLQMCDDEPDEFPEINPNTQHQVQQCNWQVLNCSTPANYFHALRRQIKRNFRKPCIIATPKSLLKLRACTSVKEDFFTGTRFQRLIPAPSDLKHTKSNPVKRHIFCSGKVYYDLLGEVERQGKQNELAISRVEQIAPFPFDTVKEELERFPEAEIVWMQEEPQNMGAWAYVEPRFFTTMREMSDKRVTTPLTYIGRPTQASPATGFPKQHKLQCELLLQEALSF